ncbi:MAG: DNA-directed RNA polymerase subunit omega, partial [Candidatus Anammoxibacter sp.]
GGFFKRFDKMKKKKKKGSLECYYDIDDYADMVGGITKLTVLMQKRAKELIRGMPRLVDIDSDSPVEIAFEEIRQKKISLASPDDMLAVDEKPDDKEETK